MINQKNLRKFSESIDVDNNNIVFMNQVHSGNVISVRDATNKMINDTDGLLTIQKNVFLGVVTADCLPVVFFDPQRKIIGVAHAGFRGLLNGILKQMINSFCEMGSTWSQILIGIGPSIGACCYDVEKERINQFIRKFPHYNNIYHYSDSKIFLDLKKIVLLNLLELRILRKNIEVSRLCTKCNLDKFFSYRGDSEKTYGEFATVIGMR